MKTVILAGGLGTRLSEETEIKPKPMVEVGGRPILWHIMKLYAHYGQREFGIAVGYRGEVIKRYFLDCMDLHGDLTMNMAERRIERHHADPEEWSVHLADTGQESMTGGRVKRMASWLHGETFMLTYGDGVANVDIAALLAFHRSHGRLATVTAVRPPARFGALEFHGDAVTRFAEKPQTGEGWINGGYFVFEPAVLDYIVGDDTHLEAEPLARLAEEGQLMAYRHDGFWQPMDTLREKRLLESLWDSGKAPWKVWT